MRAWRRGVAGFSVACMLTVAPAFAQAPSQTSGRDPGRFISDLGQQVIQLIGDKQQPAPARKQRFAGIVEKAFDMSGIARFILGPYWRSASEQQRANFEQTFKTYMINVYWSDFSQYSGQQLTVSGEHPASANATIVSSEIVQNNGKPPVKVDWRVMTANGDYKIADVSIAGVSELITYRQEFANVISQAGGNVDALTDQLRKKVQQIGGA